MTYKDCRVSMNIPPYLRQTNSVPTIPVNVVSLYQWRIKFLFSKHVCLMVVANPSGCLYKNLDAGLSKFFLLNNVKNSKNLN